MNEENENQPAPLEAESASTEQRLHRPRRRYPRRRYRDRSNRFGSDNFNDSSNDAPNSSPATPTLLPGAWVLKRWIDPPQADLKARVPLKTASKFSGNRNLAKASLKFRAKVLDSCATRSATSCRHHRIFL